MFLSSCLWICYPVLSASVWILPCGYHCAHARPRAPTSERVVSYLPSPPHAPRECMKVCTARRERGQRDSDSSSHVGTALALINKKQPHCSFTLCLPESPAEVTVAGLPADGTRWPSDSGHRPRPCSLYRCRVPVGERWGYATIRANWRACAAGATSRRGSARSGLVTAAPRASAAAAGHGMQ
eukprot:6211856-Pleurochrysis_carterae.AAC.3